MRLLLFGSRIDRHRNGRWPDVLTTSQKIEIAEVIAGRGNDNRLPGRGGDGKTIRSHQFALCDGAIEGRR